MKNIENEWKHIEKCKNEKKTTNSEKQKDIVKTKKEWKQQIIKQIKTSEHKKVKHETYWKTVTRVKKPTKNEKRLETQQRSENNKKNIENSEKEWKMTERNIVKIK